MSAVLNYQISIDAHFFVYVYIYFICIVSSVSVLLISGGAFSKQINKEDARVPKNKCDPITCETIE